MDGKEGGAVANADDAHVRQLFLQESVEPFFPGFVKGAGGLVEKDHWGRAIRTAYSSNSSEWAPVSAKVNVRISSSIR